MAENQSILTRPEPVAADSAQVAVRSRLASERRDAAELTTEQGKTTIASSVVAKIAGISAREVAGVHELVSQGASGMISGLTSRVGVSDARMQGVSVEVGERETAVDLVMVVDYGVSIPQVAEAVRRNVMGRIQAMTGLVVKEVNISVVDLFFPEEAQQQERRVE
jgi:uncharacterized alkaline shock family protein YloU